MTLLALPGLDDISRLAGIFAILFSASSMVSSVVALFKYKADLERTVVYVGGEGLMILSVCTSRAFLSQDSLNNEYRSEALSCHCQLSFSLGLSRRSSPASHYILSVASL